MVVNWLPVYFLLTFTCSFGGLPETLVSIKTTAAVLPAWPLQGMLFWGSRMIKLSGSLKYFYSAVVTG